MRMGGFSLFLERLKVTFTLISYLKDRTTQKRALFSNPECVDMDTSGRDLRSERVLQAHIDGAIAQNGWRLSLLPDLARFRDTIMRKGVCTLPDPEPEYLLAIENAQAELGELYKRLDWTSPYSSRGGLRIFHGEF